MSDKNIVETVYGKTHKYEIVKKDAGMFSSAEFYIYRDGNYYRGSYSSLADAVRAAEKEG